MTGSVKRLAVLSGLLLGIAFLPIPLGGAVAWFALVPFLLALERSMRNGARARALFGLGWLAGFTFFLVGAHWIALLSDVAVTITWIKYPAWVAAAAYLGLFGGLTAAASTWIARRTRVPLTLAVPVTWLAIEILRGSGELGFPWFQPGYSQHAFVQPLQLAGLGGVSLVTLWVLLLNVLVWRAIAGRARLRAGLGAVLLLAFAFAWGQRVLDAAPQDEGPAIALIQGNIPGPVKWSGQHQDEILTTFIDLSRAAAMDPLAPGIVIWPETATGSYMRRQVDQAIRVAHFATERGTAVFSGFADVYVDSLGRQHYINAAGLFRGDGTISEPYAKRHLVPFGERMPFQWLIPGLGGVDFGQAEWTPGTVPVLFQSPAGPFAALICFESIFPDLARSDVRAGARWLVNITNDEWFGNSAALPQHAAMATFRAAENHVPVARCANTGLTMVIDANGRVVDRLAAFEPGALVRRLPAAGRPTPFTRFGDWPGVLACGAFALMLIGAAIGALTARRARD